MLSDLIGKPFKDGGRGPDVFDCWGLARYVWKEMTGQELPDYRIGCYNYELINLTYKEQVKRFKKVQNPPVPALVVFKFNEPVFVNHIGVYIGNGQFIHIREKTGVVIERVDHPYWKRAIQGYYVPGWC